MLVIFSILTVELVSCVTFQRIFEINILYMPLRSTKSSLLYGTGSTCNVSETHVIDTHHKRISFFLNRNT